MSKSNPTGIFNPYSEFNIEVEAGFFCSYCGLALNGNFVLGKEHIITESSVFCSDTCCSNYATDRVF